MASVSTATNETHGDITSSALAPVSLELADKLSYQGFDPLALHAILRKYNQNALQLNIDIEFLVTLTISRGSNVFYKTTNLPAEIRSRFSRLVGIYHIERKLSHDSTKDTVTLARILKSYPDYAFNILKEKPDIRRPVSTEMMSNQLGYKKFPSCLRGDFVFSLVPGKGGDTSNYTGIVKAVIHYLFQESKILNSRPNKCIRPEAERLESIVHYASIAWSKSFIANEKRKGFMDKTYLRQSDIDAWSENFDRFFPSYKDVGNRFGQ